MKAVWMLKNSFLWYAVTMASLALVIGGLIALAGSLRSHRGSRRTVPAGLLAFAAFAVFMILMDCARYAYLSEPDPRYRPFQLTLFSLPWGVYACAEAVLAFLLILILRDGFRYRRSHLTQDAVRETVNLLPEGISISTPDGTVLLSNLQMEALCRTLTGGVLSDAASFRRQVEAAGEKQNEGRLLQMPDGKAWRFSRETLAENGKQYDLMTAEDITEQYRITETLKEKNEHLQELQRRMKAVSVLSEEIFVAREKANARAALHNRLGQVLLMGQYWLEHPGSADVEMVRRATREMNRFLLREAEDLSEERTEAAEPGADLLQQALAMIRNIGVHAEMPGELPDAPSRRTLLAYAILECASNTVKHAKGDRITVRMEEDGNRLTVRISNNGLPPEGPIAESGGLLSLRRRIEAAGGRMLVESRPGFSLTLTLP